MLYWIIEPLKIIARIWNIIFGWSKITTEIHSFVFISDAIKFHLFPLFTILKCCRFSSNSPFDPSFYSRTQFTLISHQNYANIKNNFWFQKSYFECSSPGDYWIESHLDLSLTKWNHKNPKMKRNTHFFRRLKYQFWIMFCLGRTSLSFIRLSGIPTLLSSAIELWIPSFFFFPFGYLRIQFFRSIYEMQEIKSNICVQS